MNEPSLNYWVYRIHRIGINGQPVFAAAYMAATHLKSIEMDLASEQSHFRGFLKTYTRIEPEEFAHQHQLEAQALLGGLVACSDCMIRFGIWLPVAPPSARSIRNPKQPVPKPTTEENGVAVWLQETGEVGLEV